MLRFDMDYCEGAHPKILSRLAETNLEKTPGYGEDRFCAEAKELIRKACGKSDADVYFTVGGTQTNLVVISAVLENYEGVIAASTGHINGHEAGAIEYTGHKVLAIPGHDGKLCAADVQKYIDAFEANPSRDHAVFPGMVYISHPTEYGTLYTKAELEALAAVCHGYGIPLYLDGARLGYGLASPGTDVTLGDIADICDVFYIGGTKVGALCGEAIVFPNGNAPKHFFTQIKQHGAVLAKGRLLGIQFAELFTDGLYLDIAKNAIDTADLLRSALSEKGYRFFIETVTNQIFVVIANGKMTALSEKVAFDVWEPYDEDHTVIRFCTSWATTVPDVEALIGVL